MYKDVKFIAEIGSNHNNDMSRIEKLVKESKELGFWGVKFQLFKAERVYASKDRQEAIRSRELNPDFIPKIKELCIANDIKFGCTPFDLEAVDKLKEYVDFFKISSFDIKRLDLIKKCAETKKMLVISLGQADHKDYLNILELYMKEKWTHYISRDKLVFMHCVSGYPVKAKEAAMQRIDELKFHIMNLCSIGYSDHTRSLSVILVALLKGVSYIEMHVDLADKSGAEYSYGHCWDMKELKFLKDVFDIMTNSESGEFKKMNFEEIADPKTGLRR